MEACQATTGAVLHVDLESAENGVATSSEPPLVMPAQRTSFALPPFFLPYPNAPPANG